MTVEWETCSRLLYIAAYVQECVSKVKVGHEVGGAIWKISEEKRLLD